MPRLDHLSLPVRDWRKSRDWYKDHLGFEVEFEIPERKTAAMRDDADLTVFFYDGEGVASTVAFRLAARGHEGAADELRCHRYRRGAHPPRSCDAIAALGYSQRRCRTRRKPRRGRRTRASRRDRSCGVARRARGARRP